MHCVRSAATVSVNERFEVLPSIDSFDVRCRVPLAPEFGVPGTRGTPGTPGFREWLTEANEVLPSGGVLKLKSCDGLIVRRGNPSRLRHWNSVDGVADGMEALSVMNAAVARVMPEMPPALDSAFHRFYRRSAPGREPVLSFEAPDQGASLFRVDVCNTYSCGSEANAREFLRSVARRTFRGTRGYLFKNGLTVHFRESNWTIQYYAKWFEKKPKVSDDAKPLPFAAERAELLEYLRSVGAVRHEVKFSRDWLKSHDLVRPSSWTRAELAARLAEFSPHDGFSVRRYGLEALRESLEAAGEHPRRVSRLVHFARMWAQGISLRGLCSDTTLWRLRKALLPYGYDLSSTPEADVIAGVSDCTLKPLVLPRDSLFFSEAALVAEGLKAPEVCA